MNELVARESVLLVFLGGTLRRKSLFFYGTQTERAVTEIIVVADSSKFGRICLHRILEPKGISKVLTDAGIPTKAREALARNGVEVIIVRERDVAVKSKT
jgi:DeoR/GlpR family transcriptional regulator of sugar metabolism